MVWRLGRLPFHRPVTAEIPEGQRLFEPGGPALWSDLVFELAVLPVIDIVNGLLQNRSMVKRPPPATRVGKEGQEESSFAQAEGDNQFRFHVRFIERQI